MGKNNNRNQPKFPKSNCNGCWFFGGTTSYHTCDRYIYEKVPSRTALGVVNCDPCPVRTTKEQFKRMDVGVKLNGIHISQKDGRYQINNEMVNTKDEARKAERERKERERMKIIEEVRLSLDKNDGNVKLAAQELNRSEDSVRDWVKKARERGINIYVNNISASMSEKTKKIIELSKLGKSNTYIADVTNTTTANVLRVKNNAVRRGLLKYEDTFQIDRIAEMVANGDGWKQISRLCNISVEDAQKAYKERFLDKTSKRKENQ